MILIEVFYNDKMEPYFLLSYEGWKIDFSDMFDCIDRFECRVESLLEYARARVDYMDVTAKCLPNKKSATAAICLSMMGLGFSALIGYIIYD
mgnify:FL=1